MTEAQFTILIQEINFVIESVENLISDLNEKCIDLNNQILTQSDNSNKLIELLREERIKNYYLTTKFESVQDECNKIFARCMKK